MTDAREKALVAMSAIADWVESIDKEETPTVHVPTPEEISANVSGNPNFHLENPEEYEKRAPFYNPAKKPFTDTMWVMTGRLGYGNKVDENGYLNDPRPYKVIDKDGQPFQPTNPQAGGDLYWIKKGISDVAAPVWNALEIKYGRSEDEILDLFRNYQGGLTQSTAGWPERYRKAYEETH